MDIRQGGEGMNIENNQRDMHRFSLEVRILIAAGVVLFIFLFAMTLQTFLTFKPKVETIISEQVIMQSEIVVIQDDFTRISEEVAEWQGIAESITESKTISRSSSSELSMPPLTIELASITTVQTRVESNRRLLGAFTVVAYYKGGNGLLTATGTTCKANRTVAVDPKVIPYGTHIWIEGLGERVAEDCGGFRGKVLDVFFNTRSDCYEWGKRTRKVWVMK